MLVIWPLFQRAGTVLYCSTLSNAVCVDHRESFQFYIAQDAHFLAVFASSYAAAERKASRLDDKSVAAQLSTLHEGVAKELEMHGSYAKVWHATLW